VDLYSVLREKTPPMRWKHL